MHKLAAAFVILLLTVSGVSAQTMNPSITRMGNGLTVMLQEDHSSDLVGIDIYVKAGSRFETPKNNGVSHFVEHLLFGATRKRQAGDMDREMESIGAILDAHTTFDFTHFSTTVSSRYLSKALGIFSDAINNSTFDQGDVDRERMVLLDEIAEKDCLSICGDLLAAKVYGEHSYSLPIEGDKKVIKEITRDDILEYYHQRYVPSNMAIVIVGDFDKLSATSLVGQLFQGRAQSSAPELAKTAVAKLTKQITSSTKVSFESDYSQFLAIGFLGPPGSEYDEVCATDILMTYLDGGGDGGWLNNELGSKQSIIKSGVVNFLTRNEPGMLSILVSYEGDNSQKAKDAIFAKLAAIKSEGISQSDLDRAKRSLLGEFAFDIETVGGRANIYGFYYAVSDPMFAAKYISCVQSITNDTIKSMAKKYLDPDACVVMTITKDQEVSK